MFARSTKGNVVLAAAALTGVAAAALAQESPPDLPSYLARCDGVKDLNQRTGCQGEQALKHAQDLGAFYRRGTAELQKGTAELQLQRTEDQRRTETADAAIQCIEGLKLGRQTGAYRPEVAAGILRQANKSLHDYGACRLLREAVALSKS